MKKSLSEQQEMLLFKACKDRNGVLPVQMAEDMYSSKSSARSAIDKLRLWDYISLKTPGYFKVEKLPHSVKRELKNMQDDGSDEDESEYVAEPV